MHRESSTECTTNNLNNLLTLMSVLFLTCQKHILLASIKLIIFQMIYCIYSDFCTSIVTGIFFQKNKPDLTAQLGTSIRDSFSFLKFLTWRLMEKVNEFLGLESLISRLTVPSVLYFPSCRSKLTKKPAIVKWQLLSGQTYLQKANIVDTLSIFVFMEQDKWS